MTDASDKEMEVRQQALGFAEDLRKVEIPSELPVLPLRGVVVFPAAIVPLLVSRPPSIAVVEEAMAADRMLALVAQNNPEDEEPAPDQLYARGTAGRILKMLKYPDGSVRILVQGLRRIDLLEYTQPAALPARARPRAQRHARGVAQSRGDAGAPGEPVRQVRLA